MTSPESSASDTPENAFEAPQANLHDTSLEKPILQLERFSAWGVFGLSIITFGIYFVYWLYTRTPKANELSQENKLSMNILYAYLALYVASFVTSFTATDDNTTLVMINFVLSMVNFILYILVVFGLRKVLSEVINKGSTEEIKLGGVLTFFFSVIYFQYKINEAIDAQGEQAVS